MQQKFHTYFVILMTGFIMLTTGNTFAQSNVNMVLVLDSISKTPIAQVSIVGNKERTSAVTDENGQARVPYNATALTISCVGYQSKMIRTNRSSEKTLVIYLQPKVSSLAEVTITANANGGIFKTISDLDIHLRPINNSQEVLRIVPGLFIGQHAGGGKAEQIFLRGFDLDHGTDIQLSVDGLPVNMVSHAHGQGYADLHFVIPELIDKVNFNKGPYFADKGNFTTAGFVEFKTKKYLDQNFLKLEAGQFNTTRGIVALNLLQPQQDQRTQSLYFAAEGSFTKGFFDSPQDFNPFQRTPKIPWQTHEVQHTNRNLIRIYQQVECLRTNPRSCDRKRTNYILRSHRQYRRRPNQQTQRKCRITHESLQWRNFEKPTFCELLRF